MNSGNGGQRFFAAHHLANYIEQAQFYKQDLILLNIKML